MDKDGFMWFGTNDGICRYDGLNFKYYALDHLSGNQARTSQISVIKNDSKGNLLIGTYSLFRYNFTMDRIEQCDTTGGIEQTGRVYAIEEGKNGQIWIGSEKGLFSYNSITDSLTSYPFQRDRNFIIISLLYDDGKLWFGTRNDGLLVFDIKSKVYSTVAKFRMSTEVKDLVNCLYKDKKNVIWAGTQDNGIFKFNPMDSSLIHVYPDVKNNLSYRVRKIINDKYGNIWVGCRLGIFLQKAGTDSLILLKQIDPLPSNSRSNSIYDIFIDRNELMWAGTFSFGVSYTDFKRKPFHLYNLSSEETLFFAKMINCFTDCDDENIWVGTEENGLFCFNWNTLKFRQYKPEPDNKNSLAGVNVKALARESNGNLWIGYYSSGLDYLNLKTSQITHFTTQKNSNSSIVSNAIRSLLLDDKENLWIGTDKGIDLLKKGSQTFQHHDLNSEVLILYEDMKNQIWAGTSGNGMYRLNKESRVFEKTYSEYFTTTIKAIHVDSNNNIWVGTNKGLYFVDSRTDSLIYSGINKGLPSNAILDILEDDSQNLWVSTGAGLIKCEGAVLTPQSFSIKQFSINDGLQDKHFREFASYKNRKGEFYLGGVQGFNIFTPDSIKINPYPPKIAFTQLKIFNQNVEIGEKIKGKTVLEKAINETKLLTLSYKHSSFSIEFAALHFSNPDNNKYKFRLLPLEKEWNYSTGIRNFATYSNLRGGDYSFEVQAANSDGLWNPEPIILKIKIIPPFWKTWWFTGILICILSASAFGYYLSRISLLKHYNAELEKKVEDRTCKLKESLDQVLEKQNFIEEQSKVLKQQKDQLQELNSTKDKFFSIIAHDLRSPFQSLLGLSEVLLEEMRESDKAEQKSYVRAIYNSSHHIFSLVENLLTWSRTQTNKITFEPKEINVSSIIDNITSLLKPNFIQKNISVGKEFKSGKSGYADKNMVEMVIRNLISNAIKFTPQNGKISISLTENKNDLQIEIRDNGVGISIKDQKKLFRIDSNYGSEGTNGEIGTGLGLILCKEFIEKNNGKIWVESKLNEGSSFFFTIPSRNVQNK
jgi:ligand-binding sensor domain-containing protein/signal transduction histidine kinase